MAELKTRFEYIHFAELLQTGKTHRFDCRTNKGGQLLGWVRWYGPWRQYCFFASEGSVYSVGCLRDVAEFVEGLNERKSHDDEM